MMLDIALSETVFRLSRLRLADGVPMAIERAAVPMRFLGERRAGRRFALRRARGRGLPSGARGAAPEGGGGRARPRRRCSRSPKARPRSTSIASPMSPTAGRVEFTRSTYRSDTYDFVAELTLPPERAAARRRSAPMTGTFMAAEIAETGQALRRQLDANREATAKLAAELARAASPPSSRRSPAAAPITRPLFLKHAIELKLGLACASLGPSIASLYHAPLRLDRRGRDHHLAVGPKPRHRRHAAGGEDRGRDDDRARQRRRFARSRPTPTRFCRCSRARSARSPRPSR